MLTPARNRGLRALLRLLLLVLGLWIYYLSLHPFVLVDSWSLYWDRLMEGLGTLPPGRPSLHLIAFVLLGLLLGLSSASGQRLMGFPLVVLLPDFCLTIELLQAATTTRHPRLGDFLLDLAVAWFVYEMTQRWFARGALLERLAGHARLLAKACLALLLIFFLAAPFARSLGSSLRNWDESYALLLGNEVGGERPWSGTIQQLALYPRALDRIEAKALVSDDTQDPAKRIDRRTGMGASLFYDFRGQDQGLVLTPRIGDRRLNRLNSQGARADSHGLHLEESTGLRSAQPPKPFVHAARRSGAFTIEIGLQPTDLHQTGPARILTISQDLFHRNLTLGQVGADLVLRVRTPWNGEDGSRYEASWSRALIPLGPHHYVITFERGHYRLWRDGEEWLPRQDLSGPGIGVAMVDLYDPFASFFLLMLPMGMILSWLLRKTLPESRRRREAASGLLLIGYYLVTGYLSGTEPDVLYAVIFVDLGLLLGDLLGTRIVGSIVTGPSSSDPPNPNLATTDEVT